MAVDVGTHYVDSPTRGIGARTRSIRGKEHVPWWRSSLPPDKTPMTGHFEVQEVYTHLLAIFRLAGDRHRLDGRGYID
ncbi:unnamed protein product [Soboliphyme baturini]|uniref:Transposase n=1 Tax=Soboliphyme baturini TaxID=241478 RepID=A0A183IWZ0_9BILA|nr:unnamed protein product [Soboliphyme baturini]